MAAPRLVAGRSVRIGSRIYPLDLPRLHDSRLHVAGVVVTLHVLGQVGLDFHVSVPQILAAILTCFVLQVAITFREKRAFVWPASAMLTGSGVALIVRVPTTPVGDHWSFHQWWMFSGIAAFSLLTKYIVRRNGTHVFNPSNVGLVIAFVVLGSSKVEPLDFWWAPISNPAMVVAYLVILIGGSLITKRLDLLATVTAFWLVFTTGTAITALSGQCFTARWAFAPVCGTNMLLTLITSPEVFIFTFFMITDPRTVPLGRVGRMLFGSLVAVVCVMLMAPQETEFGAKVALLAGLTVMTAVRPFVERMVPAPGSAGDRLGVFVHRVLHGTTAAAPVASLAKRTAGLTLATALVIGALAFGARSAQGILASEPENLVGRLATRVDPSTFPNISVDDAVVNWNHEISAEGARTIVLTLAENLALENQAIIDRDATLLDAVAHGDRLDAMRERLNNAERIGLTILDFHELDDIRVTLLVPFGRQDGLSLGMIATGTVTTEVRDAAGTVVSRTSAPLRTMWALRRATGARWLIVAELPVPDAA